MSVDLKTSIKTNAIFPFFMYRSIRRKRKRGREANNWRDVYKFLYIPMDIQPHIELEVFNNRTVFLGTPESLFFFREKVNVSEFCYYQNKLNLYQSNSALVQTVITKFGRDYKRLYASYTTNQDYMYVMYSVL